MARPRMSGQSYNYDASHRCYVEDKLSRNHFGPLFGDPPKDIATKSGETHVRDRALPSCKFSRPSARDMCVRANITYICNAATYRFRGLNFGFWGPLRIRRSQKRRLCPGPISTIMCKISRRSVSRSPRYLQSNR